MSRIKRLINSYTPVEWTVFGILASTISWWPFWGYAIYGKATYCLVIGYLLVAYLFFHLQNRHRLHSKKALIVPLVMLLYFFIFQITNEIHFSYVLICLSFGLALSLDKAECNNVISLLTNYLSLSVAISLPFFLVHQFIHPLPIYEVMDISWWKGGEEVNYENHILFITGPGVMNSFRFYSLFDEPGTLGTLSAFVLWANHYNFRDKKCVIILFGAIFTFSLAFFLLSVMGWMVRKKIKVSTVALSFLGFIVFGFVLFYTLQDNEAFQMSIINRFANFEVATVDSRMGDDMNIAWDSFIRSANIFFGLGSGAMLKYGSMTSYKSFIMEFGFIGLTILLWAYKKMIPQMNWLTFFTAVLFLASFFQRADLFTIRDIFLFSCIVNKFYYESDINNVRIKI